MQHTHLRTPARSCSPVALLWRTFGAATQYLPVVYRPATRRGAHRLGFLKELSFSVGTSDMHHTLVLVLLTRHPAATHTVQDTKNVFNGTRPPSTTMGQPKPPTVIGEGAPSRAAYPARHICRARPAGLFTKSGSSRTLDLT